MHGGYVLKANRRNIGLTQEEVCLLAGLDRRTYQRWERRDFDPPLSVVMQVCECAFKIDLLDAITVAREAANE